MILSFMGISDPQIWMAYVLCIISALICVVYGALNWNKGELDASEEDKNWAIEEEKIEKEFE